MDRGNRRRVTASRRLAPGRIPDPLRAHGAWVYLCVSILAGAAAVPAAGRVPAMLAGGGFAGALVLAGSLAPVGRAAAVARLVAGLTTVVGLPTLALALGADRSFLSIGLAAVAPAAAAAFFAARRGFLSPGALSFGVTAITVAAPVAARAGGAPTAAVVLILAVLAPFFFWRTWRLARALGAGWTRRRLRRRGLLESGLAAIWAVLAATVTRLVVS